VQQNQWNHKLYDFVADQIHKLSEDTGIARANKARLRRAAGQSLEKSGNVWSVVIPPEQYDGYQDERFLQAAHAALTLYAISESHEQGQSFGKAVQKLQPPDAEGQAMLRFKRVLTAQSYDETVWHLRGLVRQMKAANIGLDFAKLAEDLYQLSAGTEARQKVCLRWAQDYFRTSNQDKENTTNE